MYTFINEFIAGWMGGVASILIAHPLDTIKVRQQNYSSAFGTTIRRTYQYEGFRGFYRGVIFPLAVFGPSNSIFFGIYGNIMRLFHQEVNQKITLDNKKLLVDITVASTIAGFFQAAFMCPVELLKTVMQASTETQKVAGHWGLEAHTVPHKNTLEVFSHVYRDYGYKGLFRGFVPMLLRDVPTSPIYMMTYQAIHLHEIREGEHVKERSIWQDIFAGGMAGIMSWIFVLPFDVVKTRIQADNPQDPKYVSIVDCFKKSYKAEGYRAFFKGLPAILLRAFPANAVLFYGYELVLEFLQR